MAGDDDRSSKPDAHERKLARSHSGLAYRGVRMRSTKSICGLPLCDIAIGPDFDKNEIRGHARGVIAIGDIATGVMAVGGLARGFIAIGGLALGAFTLGGCSLAVFIAIGGFALGTVAFGGAAVGVVAVGGAALGYYACGGGAFGAHVISGMEQDPAAVRFFDGWLPGIKEAAKPR